VWKCIFSKKFIDENNMEFHRFVDYEDDWIFVTQALSYASRVITESSIGYYWRINGKSESHRQKFIDDMMHKLGEFDKYTYGYLSDAIVDKKILGEYIKVSLAGHYIDICKNYANINNNADKKAYLSEIKIYLKETDYMKVLECSRYLKKSAFRKVMVCNTLKITGIKAALTVSRFVDIIEKNAVLVKPAAKIERRLKVK
jgi:hypothetical protein